MTLHDSIARDLAPLGGILRCLKCKNDFPLADGRIADYLRSGWPQCCEQTMMWITERELRKERP